MRGQWKLGGASLLLALVGCTAVVSDEADEARRGAALEGCVDLPLARLSINQAVEIDLATPHDVPVVAGRAGLLRAYVAPGREQEAQGLRARLTLRHDGAERVLEVGFEALPFVDLAEHAEVAPAFGFALEPDDVTTDTQVQVEIENGCGGAAAPVALGAKEVGALNLAILPLRYEADGSGRTPVLGEAELTRIHDALFARFPVRAVNVRVLPTLPLDESISLDGSGWPALFDRMLAYREEHDRPNEYVLALVKPTDELPRGRPEQIQRGLAPLNSSVARARRVVLSIAYFEASFEEQLARLMGIAHGIPAYDSEHDPNGSFFEPAPYPQGRTETVGYDLTRGLAVPGSAFDLTTDSPGRWLSDISYEQLAKRVAREQ